MAGDRLQQNRQAAGGRRQAAGGRRQAAGGRHELEDVNRRLMTVVDAIERGGWSLAV